MTGGVTPDEALAALHRAGLPARPVFDPPAIIVRVVERLERLGVTVELDEQGRLVLDGATHRLSAWEMAGVRACRDLLRWHVLGQTSGHRWVACDVCGQASLVGRSSKPKKCRLTPRCGGKYVTTPTAGKPGQRTARRRRP